MLFSPYTQGLRSMLRMTYISFYHLFCCKYVRPSVVLFGPRMPQAMSLVMLSLSHKAFLSSVKSFIHCEVCAQPIAHFSLRKVFISVNSLVHLMEEKLLFIFGFLPTPSELIMAPCLLIFRLLQNLPVQQVFCVDYNIAPPLRNSLCKTKLLYFL